MRLLFLFFFLPITLSSQEFTVEKLPEFINSPYDEIIPVPSRDGNTLYFTRVGYPEFARYLWLDSIDYGSKLTPDAFRKMLSGIYTELGKSSVKNPESSAFNQDIWIASGDSAGFTVLEHPGPPLNNALPNSMVSITPDPNTFYVINQFMPNGDMKKGFSFVKKNEPDGWSKPEPVDIKDFYTLKSDVSLTMSFDGKILILAATRFDSHDLDLYVCFREGSNTWSAPQHMGNVINSEKRELTPFLSEDHVTLFFASNRWNSTGGLDIFLSRRQDDTWKNWSEPARLTYPINSPEDESQPYFNMTSGYLYFTSQRDGSNDIFRVKLAPPQPTELHIRGRVLNKQTGELLQNVRIRYEGENAGVNTLTTANGYYALKILKGVNYQFTAEKPGFTGIPEQVLFRRDYYFFQEYYTVDLYVEPLQAGSKIELQPIFFKQSEALILEQSFDELQRLADLLHDNPTMQIRIEGHTDNIGKPEDLQRLSEERAEAVKAFLCGKGISPSRIQSKGLGAQYPINDNSTDDLRQLNRRVEIRITKI